MTPPGCAADGTQSVPASVMLVEEFLPVYDASDAVATVVETDLSTTWTELIELDLIDVGRRRPLVAFLGALRILLEMVRHLLHGERPPQAPKHLRLRETTTLPLDHGGWILLDERPQEEIALGLVGKFWRPVIAFAPVTRDTYLEFQEPGYAKTSTRSQFAPSMRRTLLSGVMRTATTDEHARRWFRRYWTLGVGSGGHVLVHGVIDLIREAAEQASRSTAESTVRT